MGKKLSTLTKKPTVAVSATYFVGYDSNLAATYTWPASALQTIAWAQSATYGVDKISPLYSTVNSNSATNWNYQGTDVKLLTGNWQNMYSTFGATSSTFIINGTPASQSVLIGGNNNDVTGTMSILAGGNYNTVTGNASIVGGGSANTINGGGSGIVGGGDNVIAGRVGFIGGGEFNNIEANNSAILGGTNNSIPNGKDNVIILGSNITASQSDMTYVSNLSSVGDVYSNRGNSVEWNDCRTTVKNNSATWYDPKLVTSTTLNFPFIASVKNISLLTTGAPADIASLTLPSWLTRYALVGGNFSAAGAPSSRVIVESASGPISAALITFRSESFAPETSASSASNVSNSVTLMEGAGTAKGINTFTAATVPFLTANTIYLRQQVNSDAAGTISVYFHIVPFI
jgi:hypothetical protein